MGPPKHLPPQRFVARPEYFQEFRRLLALAQQGIMLGDTCAIYGTGKTTLLAKLYEELAQEGGWKPIWISLDLFSVYYSNARIQDPASLEALAQNLHDYQALLVEVGQQLDPAVFGDLRQALETLNVQAQEQLATESRTVNVTSGDIHLPGRWWGRQVIEQTTIKTGDVTVVADDEPRLRWAMEQAAEHSSHAMLERFRRLTPSQRVVLFADDFCWIIDQRIGDWLLKLVQRLDRTVAIIARTVTSQEELAGSHDRLTKLALGSFSLEQVKEYLTKGFPTATLPERLSREVYAFSRGHPLMVSVVAGLIERLLPRGEAALVQLLKRRADQGPAPSPPKGSGGCPAETSQSIEELTRQFDALLEEIRRDAGRKGSLVPIGLDLGAVARRFDRALLTYVLGRNLKEQDGEADQAQALAAQRAARLLNRLRDYAFVQWFEDADGAPYARVHYLIRERLAERLRREDPARYEQWHAELARYYEQRLDCETLDVGRSDYARLHRIEDPSWQTAMTEWLYHLCRLNDRRAAQLQLTRLYVQAFDWWGAYLPFRFCQDLLDV